MFRNYSLFRTFWKSADEDANPGPRSDEDVRRKTAQYLQIFEELDASVRLGMLTEEEKKIYNAHKSAIQVCSLVNLICVSR